MGSEWLADRGDELAGLVDEAAQRTELPSVVAALAFEGAVQWQHEVGDVGAQYRIGSITKTFTAAMVMRLRDEGRLELADTIGAHLPDAPYGASTIRNLLSHAAGVSAEPLGPWWERVPGGSWDELAAANVNQVTVFPAGQRFHYSNLSYAILGELVGRHRGSSWLEAVQAELLEPLGLDHTSYHPASGSAVGTSRDPRDRRLFAEPMADTGAMAPAGQLWSTVDDLCRWADFLITGAPGVLAPESVREMRTLQSAEPENQHLGGYGLGLRLRWTADGTLVGHTGSMPGFLAAAFASPRTRISGVVVTNATTGLDTEALVAALIAAAEPGVAEPTVADATRPLCEPAQELEGRWHWGNSELLLRPTSDGFTLREDPDPRSFALVGADRYRGLDGYFAGEDLHVVRRPDGSVSHLEVVTFILTRTPYDPAAPIPGGPPVELNSPG